MTMPRLMLIILVLNLLITLGGVGANYWMLRTGVQAASAPAGEAAEAATVAEVAASEYQFFPIEKIIVSVRGTAREHYFVLDLALQAGKETEKVQLESLEPMVRNSVVSHLSALSFDALRELPVSDLQKKLESVLREDLAARNISVPFSNLLVSKLIVQ